MADVFYKKPQDSQDPMINKMTNISEEFSALVGKIERLNESPNVNDAKKSINNTVIGEIKNFNDQILKTIFNAQNNRDQQNNSNQPEESSRFNPRRP